MSSPKKYLYHISVIGCDSSTEFDIPLTRKETGTVGLLIGLCNRYSHMSCQPKMSMVIMDGKDHSCFLDKVDSKEVKVE